MLCHSSGISQCGSSLPNFLKLVDGFGGTKMEDYNKKIAFCSNQDRNVWNTIVLRISEGYSFC